MRIKIPEGWKRLRRGQIIRKGDRWTLDDGKTFRGGPTNPSRGDMGAKYVPPGGNQNCTHCLTIRRIKTRERSIMSQHTEGAKHYGISTEGAIAHVKEMLATETWDDLTGFDRACIKELLVARWSRRTASTFAA